MAVGPYGALLEAVRGVRWPAQRAVPAGPSGVHISHTRGSASEFVEYRPYRPGEESRRIDWKLLGRSDRAFVRLAPNHATLGTLVAVDASSSMDFPPPAEAPATTKWTTGKRIAVACAAIAHASGDPVGIIIASGAGERRLAPRTRRGIVAEIAATLDAMHPGGVAALDRAFDAPAARVLLVTDCLGDLEALQRAAFAHVSAGGEVCVAHVVSRGELEPAPHAALAVDPEERELERAWGDDLRSEYRLAFDSWRDAVARRWRQGGVVYRQVVDDEAADTAVRRVVASARTIGASR